MSDERILLVTGIPSKAFKGDYIYKLFGEYGAVQQVRIGSSRITKGYAIVVYEQCDSASAAVSALHNFPIDKERVLRISVYDASRDIKALQGRKRRREIQVEYVKHIGETQIQGSESMDS